MPLVFQDVKQYYRDYKEMKRMEKEQEEALAEQETQQSITNNVLKNNLTSVCFHRYIQVSVGPAVMSRAKNKSIEIHLNAI